MTGPRIVPLTGVAEPARALAEAEAIFWASAGTRAFADAAARAAYRDLWFARYAEHAPAWFFLALDREGEVIGYLAGAPVSDAPPLPGPDYYAQVPAALLERFPAHIHVNIGSARRGAGLGARLVSAFADHCRAAAHMPGFHAVTAHGSGAAAFFQRCGLLPQARVGWLGRDLTFLARSITG